MIETKGQIVSVVRDIFSRKIRITLEIETEPIEELNSLKDIALSVKIGKFRRKRSQDANAYFHALVGKLADKLHTSKAECKNHLITSYGQQLFLDNGQMVIIKSNIPTEEMAKQEMLHCMPFKSGENNSVYYKVFRGSHTYDSGEMAILIDGTIEECKNMGIETLPPKELERLLKKWKA